MTIGKIAITTMQQQKKWLGAKTHIVTKKNVGWGCELVELEYQHIDYLCDNHM